MKHSRQASIFMMELRSRYTCQLDLLDEPVQAGEHVKNRSEVAIDVLMFIQEFKLRLDQQNVFGDAKLHEEVVVNLSNEWEGCELKVEGISDLWY